MSSKVCAANAKNLRAVFSCLLLSFAGHLALSADAAAADASPLAPAWHAQYGGPKTDFATATTISDGQAFTVGGSDGDASCFASPYYVPELNCSFSVRANALQDGTQAWVYKSRGTATQVATGKGKVFAVGQGVYGSGQTNFKVVALNQKTGQVVWHNESLPKGAIEGGAFMVAVAGDRVIVVGDVLNGTQFGQTQYFIRAYDIDSGNIVWEHKSAKTGYLGVFAYVAIADGKAVAVGEYNDNFITNAYDAENGTLLWSRQEDSGGGGYDAAKAVAIRDGRVFVAGEFSTEGGQSRDDYTHVYDLNTGDTIWVSQLDSGGFDFLDAITAGKDGLFVGGTGGPSCLFFSPGTCLLTMFSLDPVTGAVLWT
ncbi:MAG TPA: PQQ-binding-like beta-propeller repeat protein, partial [Rhizomicrobium sp.]